MSGLRASLLATPVALLVFGALKLWAPDPWGADNLVPFELAGFAGSMLAVTLRARGDALWTRRRNGLLLAYGTALVFLVGIVQSTDADMLKRTHFRRWIPILAGSGFAVWTVGLALERVRGRRIAAITAVLFGLALAAATLQNGTYLGNALGGGRVRAWNVFHYYVGSKYFGELSYTGLYAATLAADEAWLAANPGLKKKKRGQAQDFSAIVQARDQQSYRVLPRADIVASFDRFDMEPDRFAELGEDTRFLRQYMGLRSPGWKECLRDLGYNPAPPWTVVGTTVSNLVPARWPWFWLISNSDVPFYILTFGLMWWGFGLRLASVIVLWLCTSQLNEARFTGGFLQYDWLCSVLCSAALMNRGRHRAAGLVLTWGAMTRVFPGFLILPFVLQAGLAAAGGLRGGPGAAWRAIAPRHRQFLGAFVLGCGLLFVASHFTGRGLQTWPEWVDKITRHSDNHAFTSNMRVGVGKLALHQPKPGAFWAEIRGDKERKRALSAPLKKTLQVLGLLLLIPALLRRRDLDALALAGFAVFLGVVLSRYYASTWALLFLVGAAGSRGDPDSRGLTSVAGLISGAVLLWLAASFYAPGKTTASYFYLNWGVYLLFAGLCLGYLVSDGRALWRARRSDVEQGLQPDGVLREA